MGLLDWFFGKRHKQPPEGPLLGSGAVPRSIGRRSSGGMLLHIVGLTGKEKGKPWVADPDKLVAVVRIEGENVDLAIRDLRHDRELRALFSEPHFRFTRGGTTPDGTVWDAGEFLQPWDATFVRELLPGKLAILYLGLVIVEQDEEER